jgi:hypothetical protein
MGNVVPTTTRAERLPHAPSNQKEAEAGDSRFDLGSPPALAKPSPAGRWPPPLPRSSALDPTRYSGHSAASRTRREVGAQAVLCPPECDHDRPEQMITITGMYTRRLLNCDDYNYWPDSEV